jgi:hypothetical protein
MKVPDVHRVTFIFVYILTGIMPAYLWCVVFLISLLLIYAERRIGKRGRIGRALRSFMPLVMAISLTALVGLVLDTMSGNPNVTIFAVPVFMTLSLIFEVRINGRESLSELLPFFLSCIIMGALMEISGVQKGHWSYSGLVSLANVILFGYVLFFYFALKVGSAIRLLVEK